MFDIVQQNQQVWKQDQKLAVFQIQKIKYQRSYKKMAHHETLYRQFLQKQQSQKQAQQQQLMRIYNLSNEPKININSTSILLKRTMQILDQFPDEEYINLQTSIDVLRAVGILQLVNSVLDAKERLQNGDDGRLRTQVEFLYFLWEMIDEEEVQCREIKEIIQVLQSRTRNQLRQILPQMYPNQEKTQNLIKCWTILSANQQYYRHFHKNQKLQPSHTHTKSNQNKQNLHQSEQLHNYSHGRSKSKQKLDRSGQLGSPITIDNYQNQNHFHQSTNKFLNTHSNSNSNKYNGPNSNKYISNLQNINQTYLYGREEPREFLYTCQMNPSQERELVDRLYRNDIYKTRQQMKKQREQQREVQQLSMCTFKPNLLKRPKSSTSKTQIKGYEKAIHRLKAGIQKTKHTQHLREYKPIGQNYQKIKQKGLNPPKFLQRKKKEEEKVLFIISFDLGRHKTNVKIRESDNQDTVAERICKIYSLKKQFFQEIREIVRKQLQMYYQEAGSDYHGHANQYENEEEVGY